MCIRDRIREAIERVVDGTDPRLRAVSHYRRKLRDAVAHSVDYVAQQVATLPPAIEVGRRRFTTDPACAPSSSLPITCGKY